MANTKIHLNSQSDLKLTGAEILQPVGIVKADLPGLVDDLASLNTDLAAEIKRATEADVAHDGAIAQEVTDRIAGDAAEAAARDKAITAEADARVKGDSDLDAKIDKEIKAEAEARDAADVALGLRIDDVISNVDPAALDSLTEVVAAFQSADSDLNQAITDVLGTHTSELTAHIEAQSIKDGEQDAAIAAEAKDRDAAIAAEQKARASAIEAVQADVDQNEADADAAIAAEEAARIKADDAEATARAAADDAIIAAVGYNDRGDLVSKLFAEYAAFAEAEFEKFASTEFYPVNEANFAAWLSRQDEDARKELDANLSSTIKEIAEELNKADGEIIAAVGYNDRGEASDHKYNEYAAQTEEEIALTGGSPYAPINEANFQAWLDFKKTQEIEQLSDDVQTDVDTKVAELTKADEAIIAAVGYNNRGPVSDLLYNEYSAETEAAIEAGGSEFAPINEANFQAWLDNKTSSQLKDDISEAIAASDKGDAALQAGLDSEIARAEKAESALDAKIDKEIKAEAEARDAADVALGLRIDDVISNTDPAALDSLSEIVAAFQSADSDLSQSITDVLGTHTSELNAHIKAQSIKDDEQDAAIAAGDKANSDALSAHITAQLAIDATQDAAIAAEVKDRAAAIAAEAKDRAAADDQLTADLATEAKDRAAADDQLTTDLAAEAKTREDADAAINNSISKLSVDTNNQFAALDQKIDEEIARAGEAEAALDGKISDIISNTDLTALDSFSEVEAGVNAGFADLRSMILDVARRSVEANFGTTEADGTAVVFGPYLTREPKVFVNGLLQEQDFDYTVSQEVDEKGNTVSTVTFGTAPVAGARVMAKGVESAHDAEDRYPTPVVFTPES